MKTIVFSNNKGGVAKTTTAATMGELLAARGQRVLLMDLDAQANLSDTFGIDGNTTACDVLMHGTCDVVNIAKRLDIVPGSGQMAGVELTGKPQPLIANLRTFVQHIAHNYDFVLIDTPPSLGVVTIAAFAVADWLVIPTQAEPYALTGLQRILDVVNQVKSTNNPGLNVAGVLLTKHNEKRRVTAAAEQALRNHFGKLIFNATVHESVAVVEAVTTNHSVAAYAPKNRVAQDYSAAAAELLKRTKN